MKIKNFHHAHGTGLNCWFGALMIACLNGSAIAAPASGGVSASKVRDYQAGDVQLEQSRVYIHVDKTGLGHMHGVAGVLKDGRMAIADATHPGALVFDMTSFVADAPYARRYLGIEGDKDATTQREVTESMLGPEVLDVAKFPTAEFAIASIKDAGQQTKEGAPLYRVDGKLTLHGVTRPVSFMVQAEPKGDWVHIRGSFAMKQSEFGITPLTKALGAIGVKDEMKVHGDLWVAAKALRQ